MEKFLNEIKSLIRNTPQGLEKKIRFTKDEIDWHKMLIDGLEVEIEELQQKLDKLRRSK